MKASEAFDLGFNNFYSGKINNPFKRNTVNYKEHERGFNQAYFENLNKVSIRERKETPARN